jgi:hypothetical protein
MAIGKLPAEDREVDNNVTLQLLNRLLEVRCSPFTNKHAGCPKNKEKLLAWALYTCSGDHNGPPCG